MMLSSDDRAALRREWLKDVDAEITRRAKLCGDDADAAWEKLLDEMYEVGQRFLAVQHPGDAEAIEELVQAKANWEIIDRIREEHDPAPVDAISIVLTRDPNLAMRMLYRCAPAHGYT